MSTIELGDLSNLYKGHEDNLWLGEKKDSDGNTIPPIDPTTGPEDDLSIYERLLNPKFEYFYKNLMSLPSATKTEGIERMTRTLYTAEGEENIIIFTDATDEDRMIITIKGHELNKELVKIIVATGDDMDIVYKENDIV